jgi:hypothetical protein
MAAAPRVFDPLNGDPLIGDLLMDISKLKHSAGCAEIEAPEFAMGVPQVQDT